MKKVPHLCQLLNTISNNIHATDADGNINVVLLVVLVLAGAYHARRHPRIRHIMVLAGDLYYREVMNTENDKRFRQVARMDRDTFCPF